MRRKILWPAGGLAILGGLILLSIAACQVEPEPTPVPVPTPTPTPGPLTLARHWVDKNLPIFACELVDLVLESDLGFRLPDTHVNRIHRFTVREHVTEQLPVRIDASFALDASDRRKVLVTLTGVVEIATDPSSVINGDPVEIPGIVGTIEVEQPYVVTLQDDENFTRKRVRERLNIRTDLETVE